LRRDAQNSDNLIWINIDQSLVHCCFHFVNAHQDGNKVILHGCTYDYLDFNFAAGMPDKTQNKGSWLKKLEFDLDKKTCVITQLMTRKTEFPTINPYYYGKDAKYAYLADVPEEGEAPKECEKDVNSPAFYKYDLQQSKIVGKVEYGYHRYAGEVFF
jgi:carotenoid cleavage dioxygenase-like enzyme